MDKPVDCFLSAQADTSRMPVFTALELLQALVALPALLLSAFLFWRRSLWPLATFLALLALQMGLSLVRAHHWPVPAEWGAGLDLAYGPLMLALVRYLSWRDRPGLSRWHALPPLLMPLALLVWPSLAESVWWIVGISASVYVMVALHELGRYHQALRATHSAFEVQSLTWLRACLWTLLGVIALDVLRVWLRPHWPATQPILIAAIYLSALGFVCVLVWRALHQPLVFAGLPGDAAQLSPADLDVRESTGESAELAALATRIEQHLHQRQPHLDPDLTVQLLAEQLGCPPKQVSLAINQVLGRNFNDLINAARVETACRLLRDPQRSRDKLLSIQMDAGFGSRTVFNAAFKRETGLTPSQWRQQQARAANPTAGECVPDIDVRNQDS